MRRVHLRQLSRCPRADSKLQRVLHDLRPAPRRLSYSDVPMRGAHAHTARARATCARAARAHAARAHAAAKPAVAAAVAAAAVAASAPAALRAARPVRRGQRGHRQLPHPQRLRVRRPSDRAHPRRAGRSVNGRRLCRQARRWDICLGQRSGRAAMAGAARPRRRVLEGRGAAPLQPGHEPHSFHRPRGRDLGVQSEGEWGGAARHGGAVECGRLHDPDVL